MKNVCDDRRATRLVTAPPWAARVPGLDLPEVHRVKSRADHGRAGRREVGGTPCQPTKLARKTIGAVGPRMAQGKPQAPTARGQENAGGRSLDDQAELLGHIDGKHQVPAITATRDLGPRQHTQGRNTDELSLDTTSQHEVGGARTSTSAKSTRCESSFMGRPSARSEAFPLTFLSDPAPCGSLLLHDPTRRPRLYNGHRAHAAGFPVDARRHL